MTGAVLAPDGSPDPSLTTLARWLLAPEAGAFTAMLAPEPAPAAASPVDPNPTAPVREGR